MSLEKQTGRQSLGVSERGHHHRDAEAEVGSWEEMTGMQMCFPQVPVGRVLGDRVNGI